jgi:hypothetical protein
MVFEAGVFVGPAGLIGASIVCIICLGGCAGACYEPTTIVMVPDPLGKPISKMIGELQAGDKVLTIEGNEEMFTEVLFVATKTNETVEFVKLSTSEGELVVTVDHGLLMEDGEGRLVLTRADEMEVGGKIRTGKGYGRIEGVKRAKGSSRVTVGTRSGTLLANSILTSTICGDSFKKGEALSEVLPGWLSTHGG